MIHLIVDGKHYVASDANVRERGHRTPAGMLYELKMAIQPGGSMEGEVNVLQAIARAESRQWFRRMVAAGIAAGASFAVMRHLIDALLA